MNYTIIKPEVGDKIASLINTLEVATIMIQDADDKHRITGNVPYIGEITAVRFWMNDYNKTADKLALLGINVKVRYGE